MFFDKVFLFVLGWFAVLEPRVLSRDKGEHPDHGVALRQPDPRLQRARSSGFQKHLHPLLHGRPKAVVNAHE